MQRQMAATDSKASVVIKTHQIVNQTNSSPSNPATDHSKHKCIANEITEQIPLAANPSILLHVLSSYELEPNDLAALEGTCKFFRSPANFEPDAALSLPELAALDACRQKAMFKSMKQEEKEKLKQRCGGSWKLVLGYLLAACERSYRGEKSQVVAGPGHSIVVTTKGDVYSFGANASGQLGLGNTEDQFKPCLVRSLQGIRITQAAVGSRRTMLVSDTGSVYTFGQDAFGGLGTSGTYTSSPKLLKSLEGIFVVQASVGGYFSAVLSREGQVYTFSWGRHERLGHRSDLTDVEPRLLSGPLENAAVVQIAAGNCFLLMLACQPTGMSVYSLGCGQGGKLGHGSEDKLVGIPTLIQHLQALDVKPLSISAGAFHCALLALDGRVFTWGRGNDGCLGHHVACESLPKQVIGGLQGVKARHLSCGFFTAFLIADDGKVYSFGRGDSLNLGVQADGANVWNPKLATLIAELNEKVVQISATNTRDWIDDSHTSSSSHTLVLTESGRLYSFGTGTKGQLGVKLVEDQERRATPERVDIDLA